MGRESTASRLPLWSCSFCPAHNARSSTCSQSLLHWVDRDRTGPGTTAKQNQCILNIWIIPLETFKTVSTCVTYDWEPLWWLCIQNKDVWIWGSGEKIVSPLVKTVKNTHTHTQEKNTLCFCNICLDNVKETPWDTCTKWSTEWERWILCTSRGCCFLFRSTKSMFPEAVPTAAHCAIGQQATHVTWTDTDQNLKSFLSSHFWVSIVQSWGDLSA